MKGVNEIVLSLVENKSALKFQIGWPDHGYFLGCLFCLVQYTDARLCNQVSQGDRQITHEIERHQAQF